MKVKEIIKMYKDEFTEVETYFSLNRSYSFHTDSIVAADINQDGDPEINMDAEVITYELMDEEDYNTSVLANSSISFTDIYGKDDKILVILIKEE